MLESFCSLKNFRVIFLILILHCIIVSNSYSTLCLFFDVMPVGLLISFKTTKPWLHKAILLVTSWLIGANSSKFAP